MTRLLIRNSDRVVGVFFVPLGYEFTLILPVFSWLMMIVPLMMPGIFESLAKAVSVLFNKYQTYLFAFTFFDLAFDFGLGFAFVGRRFEAAEVRAFGFTKMLNGR